MQPKYKMTREEWVNRHFGDKDQIESGWDKTLVNDLLEEHEIEPLERTIREVKIGDTVFTEDEEFKVVDIGKSGFVTAGSYFTFEQAEEHDCQIKQPEPESEIEIAEEIMQTSWFTVKENIDNN